MIVQHVVCIGFFHFRIFRETLMQDPYALSVSHIDQTASFISANCRDTCEFASDLRMQWVRKVHDPDRLRRGCWRRRPSFLGDERSGSGHGKEAG